jgi:hypothetical protein
MKRGKGTQPKDQTKKENANMPIWCFVSFLEALFP